MDVNQALEYALDGDAMLFVGAGFSLGATNLRGKPFMTGSELADHLSGQAGLPEGTPLDDASEEYVHKHGEDRLIAELQKEYKVSEIGEHHLAIAGIPWRRIYTTNYDNVLETSYTRRSLHLTSVTVGQNIRTIPKQDALCIHLNGYIDRLDRETLWSEFKLTDTSYVSASLIDSPWLVLFRQDLRLVKAVFFLGYSLADLDIKRLLYETSELRAKTFFVLGGRLDTTSARRASRFGTVLPIDTAKFALNVSVKSKTYAPTDRPGRIGYSVSKFNAPTNLPPFSDRLVFDLLLLGRTTSPQVWSSLHGGERYFLERSIAAQVTEQLSRADPVIVVHSDLGNGKTLLVEGIKCSAIEQGYEVYVVTARTEDLLTEIAAVLGRSEKMVLVIDDYPEWFDIIEYVGLNGKQGLGLLLTARSSVHDVMIDRLSALLGGRTIAEISVDRLSTKDLEWLLVFLDEYGLWGEKASWSRQRKLSHLEHTCNAQFSAILISVLESPQMFSRLSDILGALKQKHEYYDVVLSVLILTILHYPTSIDSLVDIWGERVLEVQFRKNAAVRELLDVQRGDVLLRSAVAAQFILLKIADAARVTDVLTRMARTADRAAATSRLYWDLLRRLMQFSNLQLFVPEQNRRVSVIRYYEGVKNLSSCKRNPHFWLQYAIAALVLEEFDRAERYFKTAYSLAEDREGYDTFMIDNHFARFVLAEAISKDDPAACMGSFRKARRIIGEQIKSDRMHYPYRVACGFAEFYDTFQARLSPDHRAEIARAAKYILERIEQLPEERRKQKYVVECANTMEYIVELASATGDDG